MGGGNWAYDTPALNAWFAPISVAPSELGSPRNQTYGRWLLMTQKGGEWKSGRRAANDALAP